MSNQEKLELYNMMVSQRNSMLKKFIAVIDDEKWNPSLNVTEVFGVLEAVKVFLVNRVNHTKGFEDFPFEGDYIPDDFKKQSMEDNMGEDAIQGVMLPFTGMLRVFCSSPICWSSSTGRALAL